MHQAIESTVRTLALMFLAGASLAAQKLPTLSVAPPGSSPAAQFSTVQEAVNAAPASGGAIIRIRPGTYREVVHIDKPAIELRGDGSNPAAVVIVFANAAANTCGTSCSATVFVTGDGFIATGLTIANDWSKTGKPRSQALALNINADRAVLRDVRLLGNQDTLLATSRNCRTGASGSPGSSGAVPGAATSPDATTPPVPCRISRQFYDHCYIEGEVDFIFGNAKAVFNDCEIRSVAHPAGGFLTANGRSSAGEDSGYVFNHCRLTAEDGVAHVFLGRPWRDFAKVIFINTDIGPHIVPEGWSEWHKGETTRLTTAVYAEYRNTGPGANPTQREPLSRQLTPAEAAQYETKAWLSAPDHWDPTHIQ